MTAANRTPLHRVSRHRPGADGRLAGPGAAPRRTGRAHCGLRPRGAAPSARIEMGCHRLGTPERAEAVAESDYVFLCTPVETSIALLAQIAPHLRPGALVSDVGSTKQTLRRRRPRDLWRAGRRSAFCPAIRSPDANSPAWSTPPPISTTAASGCSRRSRMTAPRADRLAAAHRASPRWRPSGRAWCSALPQEHDRIAGLHQPPAADAFHRARAHPGRSRSRPTIPRCRFTPAACAPCCAWPAASRRCGSRSPPATAQNIADALERMEAALRTLRESLGRARVPHKVRAGARVCKVPEELNRSSRIR